MPATAESQAYGSLVAVEPAFAPVLERVGPVDPFHWPALDALGGRFAPLVFHITGQQISAVAAQDIFNRLVEHVSGVVDAEHVARVSTEDLRALGFSQGKANYLLALAAAQLEGTIDLDEIDDLPDDEVFDQLTALPGIGPWTAQTFLIFQLHRPDVFPSADVALRHGIQRLWGLDSAPTVKEATTRSEPWSPYRTYAAALLWHLMELPLDNAEAAVQPAR